MKRTDYNHVWDLLGSLGYHAEGTIKRGRQLVGYYYKLDRLTDADMEQVRKFWPDAERMRCRSQYSPEQVNPVVFLPSRAERNRRADAERSNAPSFYKLPGGWSWWRVSRDRGRWEIDPRRYPLATARGCVGWSVPMAVDFSQLALFA